MIAAIRTMFACMLLVGERQYRALLKKNEHERRYQRLFLMKPLQRQLLVLLIL